MEMRQVFCIILLPVLLFTFGCGGKQSSPVKDEGGTAAVKEKSEALATDSFKYSLRSEHGTCDVFIDYPVSGPHEVVAALKAFVKSTLFEDGGETQSDDPQDLVRAYCADRQAHLAKTLEQMGISQVSRDNAPEEGIEIRKVCQTSRFITFEVYRYSYITHGAHGEYSEYGATFRIRDGHRFGNDLIEKMDETLYAHFLSGMREYFKVSSNEQVQSVCTVDLREMPLPTFPPYLVHNGVRYHYSIYDICPFDMGDPVVTIPYSVALPYMTKEGREMVGDVSTPKQ